jgi:hypothetical protein
MSMKRIFTKMLFLCLPLCVTNLFAQDTIVGWTFPSTSADSIVDFSIGSINTTRYLSCQYGTYGLVSYHSIPTDYTTNGSLGSPDKCGKTTGWDNGADSAYWMVKFKTTGYGSLKLYSKIQAGGSNPGPRDFKVQYKLTGSTSPWIDIPGGTIICANDWTTGAVDGLDIPTACNNQSSQLSIRWLQTSNFDYQGGTLLSSGISKIDDIIVTGSLLSEIKSNEKQNLVQIYPNPSNGSFIIENISNIKHLRIYNLIGKLVFENVSTSENKINFSGFEKGLYLIQIMSYDNELQTSKIIVE